MSTDIVALYWPKAIKSTKILVGSSKIYKFEVGKWLRFQYFLNHPPLLRGLKPKMYSKYCSYKSTKKSKQNNNIYSQYF